jgi:hypothetical protein
MRAFPDSSFSDRSRAPMPADRAAAQPWLVAGQLLFAPFAPRDGGPTGEEVDAIQAMGERLDRDRRAGLLPDSVAYWFGPIDGRTTPLTVGQAWLRLKVMQHVVVDMKLMQAMGRVISADLDGTHRAGPSSGADAPGAGGTRYAGIESPAPGHGPAAA